MIKDSLKTIALSLAILSLIGIAYAWTEPTSNPPISNTSAPLLTVPTDPQITTNSLQVNGFRNIGDTILEGTTTINSDIKIGNSGVSCTNLNKGLIRYNATSNKLEYCNGASYKAVANEIVYLVNGSHNEDQCAVAGGTVVDDGTGNKMCQFSPASSCPATWTQYKNWSGTTPRKCTSSCGSCTTGDHYWGNISSEKCNYQSGTFCAQSNTCTAAITQLGCY